MKRIKQIINRIDLETFFTLSNPLFWCWCIVIFAFAGVKWCWQASGAANEWFLLFKLPRLSEKRAKEILEYNKKMQASNKVSKRKKKQWRRAVAKIERLKLIEDVHNVPTTT